jgi:hypothetical protein
LTAKFGRDERAGRRQCTDRAPAVLLLSSEALQNAEF